MSKSYRDEIGGLRSEMEVMKHKALFYDRYFEAYNILMEYWDFIPDEEKHEVHEKLEKLDL